MIAMRKIEMRCKDVSRVLAFLFGTDSSSEGKKKGKEKRKIEEKE